MEIGIGMMWLIFKDAFVQKYLSRKVDRAAKEGKRENIHSGWSADSSTEEEEMGFNRKAQQSNKNRKRKA